MSSRSKAGDAHRARRHGDVRHREAVGERVQRPLQLAARDRALAVELAVVERGHQPRVDGRALVAAVPVATPVVGCRRRSEEEHRGHCR
jgi:hypothetical protein